jgi:hypothetical protein
VRRLPGSCIKFPGIELYSMKRGYPNKFLDSFRAYLVLDMQSRTLKLEHPWPANTFQGDFVG